eukprot:scaffold27445_cov175-Skeletonema_marinoi.AAC.2
MDGGQKPLSGQKPVRSAQPGFAGLIHVIAQEQVKNVCRLSLTTDMCNARHHVFIGLVFSGANFSFTEYLLSKTASPSTLFRGAAPSLRQL